MGRTVKLDLEAVSKLLDIIEHPPDLPVGAPGSLEYRAWLIGRSHLDTMRGITLALGCLEHGDVAAAMEELKRLAFPNEAPDAGKGPTS